MNRFNARLIVAAAMCLSFGTAQADPQLWMKKLPPFDANELALNVEVEPACPVTEEQALKKVQSVLIRSRLKPIDWKSSETLGLSIVISCIKDQRLEGFVFQIAVQFVSDCDGQAVIYPHSYGGYGTSPNQDFIIESLEAFVEDALVDYLQANFDLAPE